MDTGRGCKGAQDEEGWLLMGRHPNGPPRPEQRDNLGALFDEVEREEVYAKLSVWLVMTLVT